MLFLAVWHGLHSGYYVTFVHEFIVMYVERDVSSLIAFKLSKNLIMVPFQLQALIKSNDRLQEFVNHPIVKLVLQVVLRLYTFIFMGWSLLPFVYLQFPRYDIRIIVL